MKISVLMENTAASDEFQAEHGLSLYLETGHHKILFDTGQSATFTENAKRLGVDLAAVDLAVLSHGHYDHGGGLKTFLSLNDSAPVYLSRYAFEDHLNPAGQYNGLDQELADDPRLIPVGDFRKLDKGIELFSCNDRERKFDITPFGLSVRRDGSVFPEDFRHEQYLLVNENGTRFLFTGCSHKGVLNLAGWFSPDVMIGGFHFMKLEPKKASARKTLDEAARGLLRHNTVYYTCHCTGADPYAYLKTKMGSRLHSLSAGQTLEL